MEQRDRIRNGAKCKQKGDFKLRGKISLLVFVTWTED